MSTWACGKQGCEHDRAWHARTSTQIRETSGPDDERQFEYEHPDGDVDDEAEQADENRLLEEAYEETRSEYRLADDPVFDSPMVEEEARMDREIAWQEAWD